MKSSLALNLLLTLTACAWFASCNRPRPPWHPEITALTHIGVIDVAEGKLLPDQTVVVDRDRIVAVGPFGSVAIPEGAPAQNAEGKFLIPGLVDSHIHLTAGGEPEGSRQFIIPLLLANGITSVRDMGGYLESLVPLRKDIRSGKFTGPDFVTPGPYLDGTPPSFQPSVVVTNRVQGEKAVDDLLARGVDFIKVQSLLHRDAYFAIAAESRRKKVAFVGHVPDRVTAAEASRAGQHTIEHLTNVLRGCAQDEAALMREQFRVPPRPETPAQAHARVVAWQRRMLDQFSDPTAAALLQQFKSSDTWQTPTLILLQNDAFPTLANAADAENDERLKHIPGVIRASWKKSRTDQMARVTSDESALRAALLQKSMDLVKQMQASGIPVLAGTDAPAPYVLPGFSLHEELALLVRAGLTPAQALRAATLTPAELLHVEKDRGSIAPGKYADLVVLDANPLEDIHNTTKIDLVYLRGTLLYRPALDTLLEGEAQFAATH